MTFPDEAFTITGGCNCDAVRYRVQVPKAADRPRQFFYMSDGPDEAKVLPVAEICHCDACRTGTGGVPTTYLKTVAYMVTVSAVAASADAVRETAEAGSTQLVARKGVDPPAWEAVPEPAAGGLSLDDDETRPPFLPAEEVLTVGGGGARGTWLRFYRSAICSREMSRSFCGRCGSSLGYLMSLSSSWSLAMPEGGRTVMLDLVLSTVDKEWLEKEWMKPEIEVWLNGGFDWVKRMTTGLGAGRYEKGMVTPHVVCKDGE